MALPKRKAGRERKGVNAMTRFADAAALGTRQLATFDIHPSSIAHDFKAVGDAIEGATEGVDGASFRTRFEMLAERDGDEDQRHAVVVDRPLTAHRGRCRRQGDVQPAG